MGLFDKITNTLENLVSPKAQVGELFTKSFLGKLNTNSIIKSNFQGIVDSDILDSLKSVDFSKILTETELIEALKEYPMVLEKINTKNLYTTLVIEKKIKPTYATDSERSMMTSKQATSTQPSDIQKALTQYFSKNTQNVQNVQNIQNVQNVQNVQKPQEVKTEKGFLESIVSPITNIFSSESVEKVQNVTEKSEILNDVKNFTSPENIFNTIKGYVNNIISDKTSEIPNVQNIQDIKNLTGKSEILNDVKNITNVQNIQDIKNLTSSTNILDNIKSYISNEVSENITNVMGSDNSTISSIVNEVSKNVLENPESLISNTTLNQITNVKTSDIVNNQSNSLFSTIKSMVLESSKSETFQNVQDVKNTISNIKEVNVSKTFGDDVINNLSTFVTKSEVNNISEKNIKEITNNIIDSKLENITKTISNIQENLMGSKEIVEKTNTKTETIINNVASVVPVPITKVMDATKSVVVQPPNPPNLMPLPNFPLIGEV